MTWVLATGTVAYLLHFLASVRAEEWTARPNLLAVVGRGRVYAPPSRARDLVVRRHPAVLRSQGPGAAQSLDFIVEGGPTCLVL